jgi:hypothetical protein
MELADSVYAEARERVWVAQQRQSVGMLREPLGEQGVAGGANGVGVVQGVLVVQDELPLLFQRVSGQGRVQQASQQGLQRLAPTVGQHAGTEARPVALGGGVQYAACVLERAVQCVRRQSNRAAKEQVFQQVCDARSLGGLLRDARPHPDLDGSKRHVRHALHDNLQSVCQLEAAHARRPPRRYNQRQEQSAEREAAHGLFHCWLFSRASSHAWR